MPLGVAVTTPQKCWIHYYHQGFLIGMSCDDNVRDVYEFRRSLARRRGIKDHEIRADAEERGDVSDAG